LTIKRVINESNVRYNWVKMPFKPDFIEAMNDYYCLPVTSTEDAQRLRKENRELRVREEAFKAREEALRLENKELRQMLLEK